MNVVVQEIPGSVDFMVAGNINGNVKKGRIDYDMVHDVLDFTSAYELAIVNTFFFRKRDDHYITYKSGRKRV